MGFVPIQMTAEHERSRLPTLEEVGLPPLTPPYGFMRPGWGRRSFSWLSESPRTSWPLPRRFMDHGMTVVRTSVLPDTGLHVDQGDATCQGTHPVRALYECVTAFPEPTLMFQAILYHRKAL